MLELAFLAGFSANAQSKVLTLPAVSEWTLRSSSTFTFRVKGALISCAASVVEDWPLNKGDCWQQLIAEVPLFIKSLDSFNVLNLSYSEVILVLIFI